MHHQHIQLCETSQCKEPEATTSHQLIQSCKTSQFKELETEISRKEQHATTLQPTSSRNKSLSECYESPVLTPIETTCSTNKPKKRPRDVNNWGKVKVKRLKKSGQAYKSITGEMVEVEEKWVLRVVINVLSYLQRKFCTRLQISIVCGLLSYLLLCQRDYLNSYIEPLGLKYRHVSAQVHRKPNSTFYITKNEQKIRVCLTFMINTIGITKRKIRTAIYWKMTSIVRLIPRF